MSLSPDYRLPKRSRTKWNDIEAWRNHNIPTFAAAIHLAGGDLAHWRTIDVQYDADGNVTQILYQSPTDDQAKATFTYSSGRLSVAVIAYKRMPAPGVFEATDPDTITMNWVDGNLSTYTWS